ncbi:MAG: hypothetical protein U5K31_13050 [Balneolaceae bacterium]|nr:hypothetical protein [Balneolaceae bacterium]
MPFGLAAAQNPAIYHTLEEELVIREHGEWQFGEVGDILADTSGNIYVSDRYYGHIKVLGPGGELLRAIGREGRGPGEFQDLVSTDFWKGELLALDRTAHRVSWLDARTEELLDEFTFRPQDVRGSNGTPYQVMGVGRQPGRCRLLNPSAGCKP